MYKQQHEANTPGDKTVLFCKYDYGCGFGHRESERMLDYLSSRENDLSEGEFVLFPHPLLVSYKVNNFFHINYSKNNI